MPNDYLTTDTELASVANAIRTKGGTSTALVYPDGFVSAIQNISTVNNQAKTSINPSTSSQTITPDSGYTGLSSVQINAMPSGTITNNTTGGSSTGTINRGKQIKIGAGYYALDAYYTAQSNSGTVAVSQSGTSSCDGYANVTVPSATPAFDGGDLTGASTATGTNVTLAASGNTGIEVQTNYSVNRAAVLYNGAVNAWVTKADNATALTSGSKADAGSKYYVTALTIPANKTFPVTNSGTANITSTGAANVTANGGAVSVNAKETSGGSMSSSKTIVSNGGVWITNNVNASGTYYGRTVVGSGSATTPSTTITSTPSISVSSSGLITASNNKTQNVTPTINSGYVSSGTAGTITVSGSNTSQLTTQAAQTITPTTTNQTIASGKYLTGTQTILGSANLIPSNIKQGVTIFGVTGTHQGVGRYQTITGVNPTTSSQTITPDSGYDALSSVQINAMPSGSATTPATTATATVSISFNSSTGVITATASGTKSVTPTVSAGYVSSGTAGTITVSGSNTYTIPVWSGGSYGGATT